MRNAHGGLNVIEPQNKTIGLNRSSVRHVPYSDDWPALFRTEHDMLRDTFAAHRLEIEHIGSTAVPGLMARPVIDIAVSVPEGDQEDAAQAVVSLGYVDCGYASGRLFVRTRDSDVRTHTLLLYRPDDPAMHEQVAFRDVLRRDRRLADAYAALKHGLARRSNSYAAEKTQFIRRVLLEANLH